MNKLILGIIVLVLIAGVYLFLPNRDKKAPSDDKVPETEQQQPEENDVETTTLSAVSEYSGTAEATREYNGEMFVHTVTADIDDPQEGKFYEGWLVKQKPEFDFFSTGKMEKEKDKYFLEFESETDYTDYPEVVITEETESLGLD